VRRGRVIPVKGKGRRNAVFARTNGKKTQLETFFSSGKFNLREGGRNGEKGKVMLRE